MPDRSDRASRSRFGPPLVVQTRDLTRIEDVVAARFSSDARVEHLTPAGLMRQDQPSGTERFSSRRRARRPQLAALRWSRCCKDDTRIDLLNQRRRLAARTTVSQEDRREYDAVCNRGAGDDRAAAKIDHGTSFEEAGCPTAARPTRERVTGAMTYLHCPRCRLAINSRAPYLTMTHCPRCLARAAIRTPLFASALNGHELRARQTRRAGDSAQKTPRLEALLAHQYAREIPPRVT